MDTGRWIFLLALLLRVGAIVPATYQITTYSRTDPVTYAEVASFIARGLRQGTLVFPDVSYTNRTWGLFLSPFWLLPGPSAVYARLVMAVVGAVAVYNVYVMAKQYHSPLAGIAAAVPMAVFPTHFLLHGTLMRDPLIICGLTTAARIFIAPPDISWLARYSIGGLGLAIATLLRTEHWPLYALVIAAGLVALIYEFDQEDRLPSGRVTAVTLAGIGIMLVLTIRSTIIDQLLVYRQLRVGGSSQYLVSLWPNTLWKAVVYAPPLGVYFFAAPFPWMVSTVPEAVASIEGLLILSYSFLGLWGVLFLVRNGFSRTVLPLVVGTIVGVALYGLVITNYGAATRLRQVFTWVVFLFGGVTIAHLIRGRFNVPPWTDSTVPGS